MADDSELLEQLRQGNGQAFRQIYDAYGRRLYYFARSLNLSAEDADEIVQETFVRLWIHHHRTEPGKTLHAYLITIARNLIYNLLKKKAVKERYINELMRYPTETGEIDHHELHRIIEKGVEALPDKRKRVFRMSRFEGYSNQQIAEELCISKSTVENHLNKALKQIKKLLDQYGYGILIHVLFLFGEINF